MEEWLPLFTDLPGPEHPMERKKLLAGEIVRQCHDERAAREARRFFEATIQNKELPAHIPETPAATLVEAIAQIRKCSKAQARQLLAQGGVRVDGQMVMEDRPLAPGQLVKVGPRDFGRVQLPPLCP
jgi:tyrosyl-tRNA synthetase